MRTVFGTALLVWIGLTIGGFGFEWLSGNARWAQQARIAYEQGFALACLAGTIWYWGIE